MWLWLYIISFSYSVKSISIDKIEKQSSQRIEDSSSPQNGKSRKYDAHMDVTSVMRDLDKDKQFETDSKKQ